MGNQNLIITIEREYGSGGRIVGRRLAEEMGLHFYDDDIIKLASEKSAVGEQFFRLADEKAGNNLLHRLGGGRVDLFSKPSVDGKLTSPENLFKFQSEVIRELAEKESCVFVGRAAGFVLDQDEEIERLVRIFVYADKVKKVQRAMEVDCIDALKPLNDRVNEGVYVLGSNASLKVEQWSNVCLVVRELLAGATVDECMTRFDQLQEESLEK